jgi:5-methylcytosine-specific restriction endonuclease McrA
MVDMTTKRCETCKRTLPLEGFGRNRARPDGLASQCNDCRRAVQRVRYVTHRDRITAAMRERRRVDGDAVRAAANARRAANPESAKRSNFRASLKRYGLTEESYAALRAAQEGLCAVCRQDLPLEIDHNHSTGRARGLLCRRCNLLVAHVEHNPSGTLAALDYLEADRNWTQQKETSS